ncbi:acyl-CoA dehydrogenase family protein [Streptomyces sp. MN13]
MRETFITNGPDADVMVVYAKLDEGDGTPVRDRQVLTFVLDNGMEGLTQGKAFKKVGMMSSPTGELFFDNVRLGMDRLLGGSTALEKGPKAADGQDGDHSAQRPEHGGLGDRAHPRGEAPEPLRGAGDQTVLD